MPPHNPAAYGNPMPQAPTAAPAAANGAGAQQIPPELARHLDPNNPLQMMLVQRIDQLTEQEAMTFAANIQPPAVAILRKVLPEIGFLLDMIGQRQGGAPMPGAAQPHAAAGAGGPMPAQPGGGGLSRI